MFGGAYDYILRRIYSWKEFDDDGAKRRVRWIKLLMAITGRIKSIDFPLSRAMKGCLGYLADSIKI